MLGFAENRTVSDVGACLQAICRRHTKESLASKLRHNAVQQHHSD